MAGHTVIRHIPQRLVNGLAVGAAGSLEGLQGYEVGVIAHDGHSCDHVVAAVVGQGLAVGVEPGLEALVKLGRAALLIEGADVELDIGALGRLDHHVGVQRVAAHDGIGHVLARSLVDDLGGVGDGHRAEEHFRADGGRVGKVRGKVAVAGGEGIGDHRAAQRLKRLLEVMAQAHVVVVAQFGQAVGGLGAQLAVSVVGQHRALEGVQEADAEVVSVAGRHLRVGAGHADGGDARIREVLRARDGHAGAIGAQHHAHALADQLLRGGRRLVGGRAVIGIDELDGVGLSPDLNGGLHAVGVLHAQHFLLAARAAVAGGGLKHADLDDVFAQSERRNHHQNRQ